MNVWGLFSAAMDKYIKQMCEKLNDPLTDPKTYWKIINRFLSNKKSCRTTFTS